MYNKTLIYYKITINVLLLARDRQLYAGSPPKVHKQENKISACLDTLFLVHANEHSSVELANNIL